MKLLFLSGVLTLGAALSFATTTDSIEIIHGTDVATIQDNAGTCVNVSGTLCSDLSVDLSKATGTDIITGTAGNWTINVVTGVSQSPSDIPLGLELTSETATCDACAKDQLEILYSDINFSPSNPSFETQYTTTITNSDSKETGSTSQSAYFSNTNTLFAETTLIGTVGPFSATTGNGATTAAFGGTGSVAPFSLTLDQVFSVTTQEGNTPTLFSFSSDGSVNSVPEPGAIFLLGSVLVFSASRLRRRSA